MILIHICTYINYRFATDLQISILIFNFIHIKISCSIRLIRFYRLTVEIHCKPIVCLSHESIPNPMVDRRIWSVRNCPHQRTSFCDHCLLTKSTMSPTTGSKHIVIKIILGCYIANISILKYIFYYTVYRT